MKYTIAIAALLGAISAEEIYETPANATSAFADKKKETKEDDSDSDVQNSEDDSDSDIQASDDSDSDVQLAGDDKKKEGEKSAEDDSDSDVQEDDSDSDVQASEDDSDSDVQEDDSDSDVQASEDDSDSDVQASEDDSDSDVQLAKDEESSDHSGEFFEAREHGTGPLDKKYERQVPTNFAEGSDDLFMRSMIKTYALEGKNKDGSPNGQFWLDEAGAKAAAGEVLATHKGIKGGDADKYFATYWKKAWGHFDVNLTGKIEVIKAPQLMRFLASDQYMSLQP
jgi:hypothetical protein